MKSNRRLTGLVTACCMAACLTMTTMADPAVYDVSLASGQGFSVAEDGMTVTTKIYPGDKIANTEVYLGLDNLNAGAAEGLSDALDDGTPCWVNKTGRVYAVTSMPVDTGIQQTDEAGNPILDEAGNPVTITDTKYVLETYGGIVETAYGASGTDATDPYTGYSLRDNGYTLRGDQTYYYTDDAGIPQSVSAADIDAAAYPNGTPVYLTYSAPADPSLTFTGWSVYTLQPDGSMAKVQDDQIPQLGIPELTGPASLGADAVNAAGGRLYITVNGLNDHLVFVPVFGAAAQEPAVDPNAVDPNAVDPNAADPNAVDPNVVDPNAVDPNAADGAGIIGIDGSADSGLDAELNADAGIITDPAQPAPVQYSYEIYVNYIDPEWNGASTGYYLYSGGDFSEEIRTASNNPEGLVFSKWEADSDAVIIDGADSATAVLRFDPSVALTENKVININAIYAEPQKTASELTIIDGTVDTDLDLTHVEEGTVVTVSAAQKSGLVFTGWTADGIEMSEEERSQATVTITMPANAVTLTAQYRMETEAQPETPAEVPAETPVEVQTEAPAEVPTEAPVEVQTEAPAEVLTAQNASIQSDETVVNEDGSVSVTVAQGETVTVVSNEAPEGQVFEKWNITSEGEVETSDITKEVLEVKVSENVTVEPVFAAAEEPQQPESQETNPQQPESQETNPQQPESQGTEPQQPESQETNPQQMEGQGEDPQQTQSESKSETTPESQSETTPESQSETQAPVYTLTVVSGSADLTSLKEGQTAVLKANAPAAGYAFSSWTVSGSGSVVDQASAQTTFTMGAANATVTANYTPVSYALTVKNGSGSGSFKNGDYVDVTANYPETGKEFDCWVVQSGGVVFDDASSYYGSFIMPASDAVVKATYVNGPDPANNAITGLENGKEYLKGSTLTFTASGAGMEEAGRNPGDYRYKPTGYQIGGVNGSWSSSPYTTSMAINAAGDYTLTVTYAKEVYDGSGWYADGTTVTKSVTFHIVTAMSVNTGDSTPLGLFAAVGAAALAAIIAVIVVLIRRRKR